MRSAHGPESQNHLPQRARDRTVPGDRALFTSQYPVPYRTFSEGTVAGTVPIGVLVVGFRRSIASGMTSGAAEG